MRQALAVLFCIIIWVIPVSLLAGECGDVNNSGAINLLDVTYLINYLYKGGSGPDCGTGFVGTCGDVDNSVAVNLLDVTYLISYLYKGGPEPNCQSYTIPDSTIIIPQSESTLVQNYDATLGTITLDESSSYAQEVSVGDVIIGQDDDFAPNGFLRKVTSKTAQSDSVILETIQASLTDAFETLEISGSYPLSPSDVISYKLHEGSTFNSDKGDELFIVDLNCVLYDGDGNYETANDQIKLEGTYSFTANLDPDIQIKWFQLKKFEIVIDTDEEVNLNLVASMQWNFTEELKIELAEFHLAAIPVGGVVILVPTLTISAHITGDLSLTIQTGITYTQQLKYGFGWVSGDFYNISECTKDFTYTPPQFSAEFDFEPGVSISASCLLYGVAGPYTSAKTGLNFKSVLSVDPANPELTFNLNAIIYAVVGIQCDILGIHLDYYHPWELYNYPIGEWIFPLYGTGSIIVNPGPDALNAPWSLSGPDNYIQNGTGDITLNDLRTGDYTISWGDIAGWLTPPDQLQTLEEDATKTFSGIYIEAPDSIGTVTDIDGNTYQTIKIGSQWWMVENLKATHYRNGDPIPNVTNNTSWLDLTTGAYCDYNNYEGNAATYGRLYNWYAVDDSRHIAPQGWHVPTDDEWKQLEMYLGMNQTEADATGWRGTDEGGKLKEAGTSHWVSPNEGAANESGFTALPGGVRIIGAFQFMGNAAFFWTSTIHDFAYAWCRSLVYHNSLISRDAPYPDIGMSVRCIKDCPPTGTVTDIDGNVYQTVTIGGQEWMAENLKVTHYRNGDPIPNVTDGTSWINLSTGAYCDYYNDENNVATYGRLYNFFAIADSRYIAPEGWHVATDAEWIQMEMYLGMSQAEADGIEWRGTDEGGKLKEAGTEHWQSPNTGATNESGFTALPGGYRDGEGSYFWNRGLTAFLWTSTAINSNVAFARALDSDYSEIWRISGAGKENGQSVRCVKD